MSNLQNEFSWKQLSFLISGKKLYKKGRWKLATFKYVFSYLLYCFMQFFKKEDWPFGIYLDNDVFVFTC